MLDSPLNMQNAHSAVLRILDANSDAKKRAANPFPTNPEEEEAVKDYYGILKNNLNQSAVGGITNEATKKEITTNVGQVIKSVSAYSASVEKPEEFNKVVELFASPEFGAHAKSIGGIPEAAAARNVVGQQYEKVVLPLIQKEYQDAVLRTGITGTKGFTPKGELQVDEVIAPQFNGAGIFFVSSSNEAVAQAQANTLNREVAPLLNRLTRMSAHFAGHTNYKQQYEEHYASLFATPDNASPTDKRIDSGDGRPDGGEPNSRPQFAGTDGFFNSAKEGDESTVVGASKAEARALSDPKIRAVAQVETGSEADPFIRTRFNPLGGSTAYGPLQVTTTLAKDMMNRKADKFTPEEIAYLDRFIKQGFMFNKFGGEPDKAGFDPKYDYGGEGDLISDVDRNLYWQVFEKVFDEVVDESAGADEIAEKWHGGSDSKLKKEYADRLRSAGID
jgi:hypothetical protein